MCHCGAPGREGGGGLGAARDGRRHHGPPSSVRSGAAGSGGCRAFGTSVAHRPLAARHRFTGGGGTHTAGRFSRCGPGGILRSPVHPQRRRRARVSRLQTTDGLTDEQVELVKLVREFVEEQILPVATELEHRDEYPTDIVEGMKEMGIFGLMIPEEYGGLGESLLTYALVVEEIARGWMSVSGIINTHFIVAYLILQHGTEEQKQRYLPRMATGEVRGAFSMSRAGPGLRRRRHPLQGGQGGRGVGRHRPEDVADQRRLGQPRRRPRAHRPRRERQPLPEHDDLPRRQGARLRRDRPGHHRAGEDREDGLQGRRHHRARPRRPPHDRRPGPRRGAGQGLLPDDGRRRGGPRQRRGAGLRAVDAGLRARHRLLASSARRSARRSPSTRASCSASPTWRPRSRRATR